ncbi:hypothetical protein [Falsigemmobacter faecalis]|uniref:Uncharacterized protein n=1 Tax=Falsigemmobacter faecalis TaxID=2488730 RepID=A0A3P3DUM7_9RHOB|nr:hypothetical protein [Falsigemmobacter faecalis]RRH77920.1 hypothetical protein EG244_02535 [Falsigemmobacter faecalis]
MSGRDVKAYAAPGPRPRAEALVLVQLTDRRTGAVHRVDGRPLASWVPPSGIGEASAQLMAGRDPRVWSVRVMEMTP